MRITVNEKIENSLLNYLGVKHTRKEVRSPWLSGLWCLFWCIVVVLMA